MNLVQIDNRTQTEPQTGGCGLGEPVADSRHGMGRVE